MHRASILQLKDINHSTATQQVWSSVPEPLRRQTTGCVDGNISSAIPQYQPMSKQTGSETFGHKNIARQLTGGSFRVRIMNMPGHSSRLKVLSEHSAKYHSFARSNAEEI